MTSRLSYLGQGIAFPVSISDETGNTLLSVGKDKVRQAIIRLLLCRRGSRFFLREYGSRLHLAQYEPNDELMQESLRFYIIEAIEDWEPRVDQITVTFQVDAGAVNCIVRYRIKALNEFDSAIYPFYKEKPIL